MKSHDCRNNNPYYYKKAMQGLLSEAKENGVKVGFRLTGENNDNVNKMELLFIDNSTGELLEVTAWEKGIEI